MKSAQTGKAKAMGDTLDQLRTAQTEEAAARSAKEDELQKLRIVHADESLRLEAVISQLQGELATIHSAAEAQLIRMVDLFNY